MTDDVAIDRPEDETDRRRLIFLILLVLLILLLLWSRCGSGDEEGAVQSSTTQATAPTPTTTTTAPPTTGTTEAPSTTTTTVPEQTISGVWSVNVDVTVATVACEGEELDEFTPDTVTITQEGASFTLVGLGFPKDEQVWEGQIDGNLVTFSGVREEDEGTTTAAFILEVDFDSLTMQGIEEWTWEGPGGSCPGSESAVTATRIGP